MAYALQKLGCQEKAIVAHGLDGLDVISTVGKTVIAHLKDEASNLVKTYVPADFSLKNLHCQATYNATPAEESAQTLVRILIGKDKKLSQNRHSLS